MVCKKIACKMHMCRQTLTANELHTKTDVMTSNSVDYVMCNHSVSLKSRHATCTGIESEVISCETVAVFNSPPGYS